MPQATINAIIAGVIIASLGLWWFRMIMKNVRAMKKSSRYGIYAAVWVAYFIATMLVIQSGAGG